MAQRKLKTIAERFEDFLVAIKAPLEPREKKRAERTFYAGFAVAYDMMVSDLAQLSDAQGDFELQAIHDELQAYARIELIELRSAKGKPS